VRLSPSARLQFTPSINRFDSLAQRFRVRHWACCDSLHTSMGDRLNTGSSPVTISGAHVRLLWDISHEHSLCPAFWFDFYTKTNRTSGTSIVIKRDMRGSTERKQTSRRPVSNSANSEFMKQKNNRSASATQAAACVALEDGKLVAIYASRGAESRYSVSLSKLRRSLHLFPAGGLEFQRLRLPHLSRGLPCISFNDGAGAKFTFLKWIDGKWCLQLGRDRTALVASSLINAALLNQIPGSVTTHTLTTAPEGLVSLPALARPTKSRK
jgi:hypothetical protein